MSMSMSLGVDNRRLWLFSVKGLSFRDTVGASLAH